MAAPSPRPLRVVRIIDRLNVGGPSKHVVWLTGGLDLDAYQTVLIAGTIAPDEGDMAYFARAAGVEPLVIDQMRRAVGPHDLIVVVKLLRHLLRLRPDIVHTHKAKAGAVGRVAVALYRWLTPSALWLRPRPCRVVHTYHGHIFHSYYGRLTTALVVAIERVLARLCTDRIITLSESQRDEITDRFRIAARDKVRVIPLGIDLSELPAGIGRLRADLGVTRDEVLIGTVGRLCEVKNHALLLEATARLVRDGDRVRLVMVGDGHLRSWLEARARALGLGGAVTFLGFRRDALRLYPDLDLVALTSLNEGTPVTLLEAMACGRPVVATAVGGVVDLMGRRHREQDGFTVWDHGVTTPSSDPTVCARALRFLISQPMLRREMGARGQSFVRTHMSTTRLVCDLEKLYRELRPSEDGPGGVVEGVVDEGPDHRGSGLHRLAPG
jgi:glycosyltransferase involved in cell wall biosynthesis